MIVAAKKSDVEYIDNQFEVLALLSLLIFLPLFGEAFAASGLEEGVSRLANQISKGVQEKQSKKIAVIDFSDLNGNVTALGQFLAEELTTQLFIVAPGKFEVVERRQLQKLAEELALGQAGFIEEKSIKKMGQILGVDAIVTGSLTDLGNTVKVNARLIGVESAKVFAVAAAEIPKKGISANLMGKQVDAKKTATRIESTTSTVKTDVKTEQSVEIKDFIFELNGCRVSGNTVTCALLITNKEKDRNLTIGSPGWGGGFWVEGFGCSRMIDVSGEEYCASAFKRSFRNECG